MRKSVISPRAKAPLITAVILVAIGAVFAFGYIMYASFYAPKEVRTDTTPPTMEVSSDDTMKTTEPDLYATWKIYKSTRDGYSLRYPSEWIVIKETASDGPYIRNKQFTGGSGYPIGYINLRVLRDPAGKPVTGSANLQPKDWYAKLGKETVKKGPVTFTPDVVDDYSFADITAKKAKSVFTEIDEDVFFLHEGDMYEINMYPYGASNNATVKKILDSFTFI